MNLRLVLFLCLTSALRPGVDSKVFIFTVVEGATSSLTCHPALSSGTTKFFCRRRCQDLDQDVVFRTRDDAAESGRYSMTFRNDSSGFGLLTVTIRNLSRADSGLYRCGLGPTGSGPESITDLDIRVTDSPLFSHSGFIPTETEGVDVTRPCISTVRGKHKFFCKGSCNKEDDILIETEGNAARSGRYSLEYREGSLYGLYVTVRQATAKDTGMYRCGYGPALTPDSYTAVPIIIIDRNEEKKLNDQLSASPQAPHPGYFLPLVVSVCVVGVLLLVVFMLLLYVWRTRRTQDSDTFQFPVFYKKFAPPSTYEDPAFLTSTD